MNCALKTPLIAGNSFIGQSAAKPQTEEGSTTIESFSKISRVDSSESKRGVPYSGEDIV